jgi:hypothetical protein
MKASVAHPLLTNNFSSSCRKVAAPIPLDCPEPKELEKGEHQTSKLCDKILISQKALRTEFRAK